MGINKILLLLLLIELLPGRRCKIYKNHITTKTPVQNRQWKPTSRHDLGGWLVRIMNSNGHFACCGSYISPLVVITSGNCIEPYRYSLQGATVEGTAYLDGEDNYAFIETVYTSNIFDIRNSLMDIAVVRLERPIKGKMTEFIKLCEFDIDDDMILRSFGWGYASIVVQEPSNTPRNFTVPVLTSDGCGEKLIKSATDKTVFCVTHPTNRRNCVYDPGCPLVFRNQLCGIVSIYGTCIDPSKPGVYTNISAVKNFVMDTIEDIRSGALA